MISQPLPEDHDTRHTTEEACAPSNRKSAGSLGGGLQARCVARPESAWIDSRIDGTRRGLASQSRAAQYLGNCRSRGVLEIYGEAPLAGRKARLVCSCGEQLVSASRRSQRKGMARRCHDAGKRTSAAYGGRFEA